MAGYRNRQSDQRRHRPKLIAARVYRWCENGGRKPIELNTRDYIDRFGVQGVFGRPLYLSEIREIVIAENIESAYKARAKSGDWAKWTQENKDLSEMLIKASHDEC